MEYLTREEVAEYLFHFYDVYEFSKKEPNFKIKIIHLYLAQMNNKQHLDFDTMINVYKITNLVRALNFNEELYTNLLTEENMTDELKYNLYRRVRNNVSHNDKTESSYNISKDGLNININEERTNTNINLSYNDLEDMSKEYINAYNNLTTIFVTNIYELPNILLEEDINNLRYQSIRLISNEKGNEIDTLKELLMTSKISKESKLDYLNNYIQSNNLENSIEISEELEFTNNQKKAIKNYHNNMKDYIGSSKNIRTELYIQRLLPISLTKTLDIVFENDLLSHIDNDTTYNKLNLIINSKRNKLKNNLDDINLYTEYEVGTNEILKSNKDINLLTYIVNNFNIKESLKNELEINNAEVADHLRNALTHGWYYNSLDDTLNIYDNRSRDRNNGDFYYNGTINSKELVNVTKNIINSNNYSRRR